MSSNFDQKYVMLLIILSLFAFLACGKDSTPTQAEKPPQRSIVTPEALSQSLSSPRPWKLIEVSKPEAFAEGHIPGALNCFRPDFSNQEDYPYGGMRAETDQMETLMSSLGVHSQDSIIVYDKKGNADALRLWWLMRLYGHTKIAVLDGGQPAWSLAGFPLSAEVIEPMPSSFRFSEDSLHHELLATSATIKDVIADSSFILLDTRSAEEFSGVKHKKGALVPGHIPGSINLDWAHAVNYGGDFCFKSPEDLTTMFINLGITPSHNIIVYCHSGVRSSHTTFVLREILGYPHVTNYDGSWIEWSHRVDSTQ